MTSRISLFVSHLVVLHAFGWWLGFCAAQDFCADSSGAIYNNVCYVIADRDVSCADKCNAEGAQCSEGALHMSTSECASVLGMLGVDIASSTSLWDYNFQNNKVFSGIVTGYTSASIFDENFVSIGPAGHEAVFKTSGCIVSPVFDATDQTSFTYDTGAAIDDGFQEAYFDAAQAHNFQQETPTCDGASALYRRVCSCAFPAPSPATPNPTPAPTAPNPTPISTPAPTPLNPTLNPTPSPASPPPTTPPPTPHTTPAPTQTLIEAGYWRTGHASGDIRPCPIPDLCLGGVGGGDELCLGDNTGVYCQVCPSSHFSSVDGVCRECGSSRGVTALQLVGLALAAILLLGVTTFVGSANAQAPGSGKNDGAQRSSPLLRDHAIQQVTTEKLREKLLELETLVVSLRRNLPDTVSQRLCPRVKHILVTIEMFVVKLLRVLPQAPNPELYLGMKEPFSKVQLLSPAIDQLASALAGLSGAVSGEEATIIAQIK